MFARLPALSTYLLTQLRPQRTSVHSIRAIRSASGRANICSVLDHNDLNVPTGARPVELYLLATLHASGQRLETKKLRVPTRKGQKGGASTAASTDSSTTLSSSTDDAPSLTLDLDGLAADPDRLQRSQLRLSVWHDLLGGFNSYFHGELRIQLDERTLKPRADRQGPQWWVISPFGEREGEAEIVTRIHPLAGII